MKTKGLLTYDTYRIKWTRHILYFNSNANLYVYYKRSDELVFKAPTLHLFLLTFVRNLIFHMKTLKVFKGLVWTRTR